MREYLKSALSVVILDGEEIMAALQDSASKNGALSFMDNME